ncbi:MAG: Asp23/Gls24 family envelope stress response protein [Actinobacteria bacterium]|nr:Asp23/Gls24 family envelope stress response protein [Actinomycetota bacterium]
MAEVGSRERSSLQTDRGTTTINDAVVTSIASTAVQEVSGAEPAIDTGRGGGSIPGDNSPTMGELFDRVTDSARGSRGVSAEVGETQTAIDLTVTVPYGRSIPDVTSAMRDNVLRRVENLTGLEVTEVNITVKDIFFPEQ